MSDEPMTPPPDPATLDEAVSAYLDGEPVDPVVRARPEFVTRLAELTRARDALRAAEPVPPLDEVTRRRMVRTALDQAPPAAGSTWSRRLVPLGAVAAVLAVIIGLGAVLASRGDDGGTSVADREAATTEGDGGGSRQESSDEAPTGVGGEPLDLGDLGDVSDVDALREELLGGELVESGSDAAQPPPGAAQPCATEIDEAVPGLVRGVGTGRYEGEPALVVVGYDDAGEDVVVVITTADCTVHSAP